MTAHPGSQRKAPRSFEVPGQVVTARAKRSLLHSALRADEQRDYTFRQMILSVPAGKVSTYGAIAAAAGYPRYHRAVAKLLRSEPADRLPWYRVLGAGGEIKLHGDAAHEQRARLLAEGVAFRGKRVDMEVHQHLLRPWEVYD